MTVTYKFDLHTVKMKRNAKYLGKRSFSSTVIIRTLILSVRILALFKLDYYYYYY